MTTATVNGDITAIRHGDYIEVSDGSASYRVLANEKGRNTLGYESVKTWGEALAQGHLKIINDDENGHSWGCHGSIYIEEQTQEIGEDTE